MEVLRIPPYPIVTSWDVPEANTDYTIYIEDLVLRHGKKASDTQSQQDQCKRYGQHRTNLRCEHVSALMCEGDGPTKQIDLGNFLAKGLSYFLYHIK